MLSGDSLEDAISVIVRLGANAFVAKEEK